MTMRDRLLRFGKARIETNHGKPMFDGDIVYNRRRPTPVGAPPIGYCRVYWGSHGCRFERGHDGPCECSCCDCVDHPDDDSGCVAKPPYYGPDTRFDGDDAAARGLNLVAPLT